MSLSINPRAGYRPAPDRRTTGAFDAAGRPGGLIGGRIWRYELSSAGGATLVGEKWGVSQDRQRPMLQRGAVPKQAEDGMRATSERMVAILEPVT